MYTNQIVNLTNEINKARGKYDLSIDVDIEFIEKEIEELDRQLWALGNGYWKPVTEKDPVWTAFNVVLWYWFATYVLIVVGGGL